MVDPTKDVQDLDPLTGDRLARAPLPTRSTLFKRKFVPYQLWRFVYFNLRTMDMVRRAEMASHQH